MRNRSRCAQRLRSRALFGWKTRRKDVAIGVSGYLPVRVTARRNEDTRRATASGNCRSGDIAAGPRHDPPPRRGLDRSVPSAGSTPPQRPAILGGCAASAGVARIKSTQARSDCVSLRGMPEPVVADLVKASRQDVLEEAPEELDARQPLGAPGVGACGLSSGRSHGSGPCRGSVRC